MWTVRPMTVVELRPNSAPARNPPRVGPESDNLGFVRWRAYFVGNFAKLVGW
jgi:hypothetical protein